MDRWWSISGVDTTARAVALACAVALMLCACDGDAPEPTDARGRPLSQNALPTPIGAPGGSVTGMPTSPPPPPAPPANDAAVAAATPETAAVAPDPSVDPNAVPIDPATGLAAQPGSPPPADLSGAGAVVRDYMAALSSGAFAGAQQLWSTTPNDGVVMQLARGPSFGVEVMPATGAPDAASTGIATVPVRIRGASDAGESSVLVTYTVRRTPEGAWRIASAAVREASP